MLAQRRGVVVYALHLVEGLGWGWGRGWGGGGGGVGVGVGQIS